jgi:hypothetical protein
MPSINLLQLRHTKQLKAWLQELRAQSPRPRTHGSQLSYANAVSSYVPYTSRKASQISPTVA